MKYTMTIGSTRRRFWLQQVFSINLFITNKLADNFGWFSGFSKISFYNKIEYHWNNRSTVCVINIWKIKMWVYQIVRLSEPIIVVCAFFFLATQIDFRIINILKIFENVFKNFRKIYNYCPLNRVFR